MRPFLALPRLRDMGKDLLAREGPACMWQASSLLFHCLQALGRFLLRKPNCTPQAPPKLCMRVAVGMI